MYTVDARLAVKRYRGELYYNGVLIWSSAETYADIEDALAAARSQIRVAMAA